MKKKLSLLLLAGLLLISVFSFAACGNKCDCECDKAREAQEQAFIGTFESTWIEGGSYGYAYTLKINEDRTFTIDVTRNEIFRGTISGTWAGNASKDNYSVICFITEGSSVQYFTLTLLDDGRIIANGLVEKLSSDGYVDGYYIVVFTKINFI